MRWVLIRGSWNLKCEVSKLYKFGILLNRKMKFFQIHLTISKTIFFSFFPWLRTRTQALSLLFDSRSLSLPLSPWPRSLSPSHLFNLHLATPEAATRKATRHQRAASTARAGAAAGTARAGAAAKKAASAQPRSRARAAALEGARRRRAALGSAGGTVEEEEGVFELGSGESANWIGFRILQERIGEKQIVIRGKNPRNS